jgi:hypothetical protein
MRQRHVDAAGEGAGAAGEGADGTCALNDAAVFNWTGPRAVLFVDTAVFNRTGPGTLPFFILP